MSNRKAGTPRNREQREKDIARSAELRLKGYGYKAIAADTGVSVAIAHSDVKVSRALWKKDAADRAGELVEISIAELDLVRRNAWEQFERSTKNGKRKTSRTVGEEVGIDEVTTYKQYGDPKYLQIIMRCSERIEQLLGFDPERKKRDDGRAQGLAALLDMLADEKESS